MARIPTYESRLEITTAPPGKRRQPITAQAEGLGALGRSIANVGEMIHRADQERQYSEASIRAAKALRQIEFDAVNDNNLDGFEKRYQERFQKARTEIINSIKDAEVKEKFQRAFELDLIYSQNRVKRNWIKKLTDRQRANLEQQIEEERKNYFIAATDSEKEKSITKIAALLKNNANLGIITQQEAVKGFQTIKNNLTTGQVEYDIDLNPYIALAELKKGEYGKYKDLDPAKRIDYIKRAETQVEKANITRERNIAIARNQEEAALINQYFQNPDSVKFSTIYNKKMQGLISDEFATQMIKTLEASKTVKAKTDLATYLDLTTKLFSPDRDPNEIAMDIIIAHRQGKLSLSDAKNLIISPKIPAAEGGKMSLAEEIAGTYIEERKSYLKTAVEAIKTVFPFSEAAGWVVRRLIHKVNAENIPNEKIPQIAKEEIKSKIKQNNPEVSLLDDVPNIIFSENEGLKEIYPGESELKAEGGKKELTAEGEYELGEVVTYEGRDYVVTGFDFDGEPLLEEIE
jgi:hypothetical protein